MRSKRRKGRVSGAHGLARVEVGRVNQVWRMDFVADNLFNGHRIRVVLPATCGHGFKLQLPPRIGLG